MCVCVPHVVCNDDGVSALRLGVSLGIAEHALDRELESKHVLKGVKLTFEMTKDG